MNKNSLTVFSLAFATFLACFSFAPAYANHAYAFSGNNQYKPNLSCQNCRPAYGYYRPATVISSGTNYINRDIGTGEIKQVVQVAPPPAYYGRAYY